MNGSKFLESLSNIPSVDYMHELKNREPSFFLKRTQWLIDDIPTLKNYIKKTGFVHITGTSGKGTVGAILQSILAKSGHNVGFYNSPHTNQVYERMRLSNKAGTATEIDPPSFDRLVGLLKPHLERALLESKYGLPSYFEILVALALLYFSEKKCDRVILEVGCGGRFDATNIIRNSVLSIITSIGDDHAHLIGPTLPDIAYEKAGIIKQNGAVLIGPTVKGKILGIIQKEAREKNAKIIICPRERPEVNINESIASQAALYLKKSQDDIKSGISAHVPLPGRFEIVRRNPLIIADGAHNADKIMYLLTNLKSYQSFQTAKNKMLVFASVDTKNWRLMLKLLIPHFDKIYLTRHTILQRKSANLKEMLNFARKKTKKVRICIDPGDAMKLCLNDMKNEDALVATGSLFLIGHLKNAMKTL